MNTDKVNKAVKLQIQAAVLSRKAQDLIKTMTREELTEFRKRTA